jgi:hypothetical protein
VSQKDDVLKLNCVADPLVGLRELLRDLIKFLKGDLAGCVIEWCLHTDDVMKPNWSNFEPYMRPGFPRMP